MLTHPFDSSGVNNYTANVWSGAITIAGTQEAVNRFGTLKHFTTDLSGTAYLPTGPDLNTGRSGAQYFTFAFRRSTMANFNITLSGKVSGLFVFAPGTDIDSASGLNGWLDASTTWAVQVLQDPILVMVVMVQMVVHLHQVTEL